MPIHKTDAFLLRKIPYRNSSFVLDILTETDGRISLIAKGAKKEKSPFYTRLEYLHALEIVYISKPHGMGILTECTVCTTFSPLRNSPLRMKYGLHFLRLIREVSREPEAGGALYRMVKDFFTGFSMIREENSRIYYIYAVFRLIEESGYSPDLDGCTACGNRDPGRLYFDRETVQFLCSACTGEKKGKKRMELSANSIKIMQLCKNRDISGVLKLNPDTRSLEELEKFELLFLSSVLERDLRGLAPGIYDE